MSTFKRYRRTLPMLDSCEGCGICCTEQALLPVSWYLGVYAAGDITKLPSELQAELREIRGTAMLEGFPPDGSPCVWYDAEAKTCKNYEHRPGICHDLKLNSPGCKRWRQAKLI